MTGNADKILLEDMTIEDNLDLLFPESFHEAVDTLLVFDEEINSYDPDSGLLFPPEIKDFNNYFDEGD